MSLFPPTWLDWLRHQLAWSNSRQSWQERLTVVGLLATGGVLLGVSGRLPLSRQVLLGGLLLMALAVCLRRGWIKLFGPVFFHDLVRTARRGRYVLLRFLYGGALALLLCWVHWLWRQNYLDDNVPVRQVAAFAESVFAVFLCVQFAVAVLLTPAYTAAAITEEKEHRTIEFILATDLRNREIVLGKFAARVANLFLLILVGLPILSLMQFLGGIDPDLVLAGFLVTFVTVGSLAALGILFSVLMRRSRDAIILTYLTAAAYLVVSALSLALLGVLPLVEGFEEVASFAVTPGSEPVTVEHLVEALNAGNIGVAGHKLVEDLSAGGVLADSLPRMLRDYALFHGFATMVCILVAVSCLRVVALKQRTAAVARRDGAWRLRWWRRPRVGAWPMLWKEIFAEHRRRFEWLGRLLVYLVAIAFFVLPGAILLDALLSSNDILWTNFVQVWVRIIGTLVACLTLLGVLLRAAGSISAERERQTLDSLLTTPLSSNTMLFAKWLGSILSMRWAWLWLALIWAEGLCFGGLQADALPMLVAGWLIYAAAFAGVGLWFSLTSVTNVRATLASLLAVIVLSFGHWLLWLVYVPFLVLLEDPESAIHTLVRLHAGLTPPAFLTWSAFQGEPEFEFDNAVGYFLCGLFLWGFVALALWFAASIRFRALSGRSARRSPEVQRIAQDGRSELELLVLLRQAQQRTQRRRRRLLAALGLGCLALAVGFYWHLAGSADRHLREAIAEADASDPRWQWADREADRTDYPPEENSAPRVLAARALLPRPWPPAGPRGRPNPPLEKLDRELSRLSPEVQLDARQVKELRDELVKVAAALKEARALAEFPHGRFAVIWSRDYISTLLPHLEDVRVVARLLTWDAALRVQEGDAEAAWLSCRAALNSQRAIGDEPCLISLLVRIAIQNLAVRSMERTLAQGEPGEAGLAQMQELCEGEVREPLFLHAMRGERAMFHGVMTGIETGDIKIGQMLVGILGGGRNVGLEWLGAMASKRAHAWGLRHLTELVEIAKRPASEQQTETRRLEAEAQRAPWMARAFLSANGRLADAFHRSQANLSCAIVALACERYRRRHQHWPESVAALVEARFLAEEPLDPFDGAPLRFVSLADGVMIYSIGMDRKDDGGRLRSEPGSARHAGDLGFRLWDATQRRQPPRNPEIGPPLPDKQP